MRFRILSFLLVGLAVLVGVTAPLGHASPAGAMAQCQSGDPGLSGTMLVGGDNMPYELAAYSPPLAPGDVYRVTVTGTVKMGVWPWDPSYTADGTGWSDVAPSDGYWPQPGLPKYGLIANWLGLEGWYWLGASSLCIQWTGSTNEQVLMEMNDDYPLDNSGTWVIFFHKYSA